MIRARAPTCRPVISITMLRRAGLFDEGHRGWIGFSFTKVESIFAYSRERNALAVVTFDGDEIVQQYIVLTYRKLHFGKRRYFYCTIAQVRCNELVYADGEFASRVSWKMEPGVLHANQRRHEASRRRVQRLLGSESKGPARGQNRLHLLATIKPNPWLRVADEEQSDALVAMRTKVAVGRKRGVDSWRAMAAVLGDGRRLSGPLEYEWSADQRARFGTTIEPAGPRELPRTFVEHVPFLAVGDLSRRKLLELGAISAATLPWSDKVHLTIECHMLDPKRAFFVARLRHTGQAQTLRLLPTGSQARWCFVCPFTGQYVTKIFFRDGLFASAAGNRLIHRSQRKADQG